MTSRMMKVVITPELLGIFREIVRENKNEDEWAELESDDMFQSEHYIGGFDATEMSFCFSYFGDSEEELWFQVSLGDIQHFVASGAEDGRTILARRADEG